MYFEDLKVGMTKKLDVATIDKNDMLDFANKYDNVPLHTDEEYARTTRFGQLIAPGVMSFVTVWAKYLEQDYFGDELIAGLSTKIEWFKPTFAEDKLTGIVAITKMIERNPYNGLVELTIDITNQNGEVVMRDVTEAVIKRKPI